MITQAQLTQIHKIKDDVWSEIGDQGSCVLGYEMYVDGERLMYQPWQGSVSCDHFYDRVKEYLLDQGIHRNKIQIRYGNLD